MTRVITALGSDEAECLFDDDGMPQATAFGNALQMWAACQGRAVTVQEAAMTFNAVPEVIRQAVEDHPWMFLDGDNIEHDGE